MMTEPSQCSNGQAARILVVDDEEIVLVALRETLQQQGYVVVSAKNAVQALETLQRERFAVVLTDQQMPTLTGLEFLAQVKKIQPETTRILITAVLSLSTVIDAINKAEIYRFILKPWQRDELLLNIQTAVARYETICRNQDLLKTTSALNETLKQRNQSLEKQLNQTASNTIAS